MQIILFATLFATVTLLAVALAQGKLPLILKYRARDYLTFAGMGFLGTFTYYFLLYWAYQAAPVQVAYIVNYTYPLWMVVFAAPILGERVTARKVLAMVVGLLGVFVVVTRGSLGGLSAGDALGSLAALAAAVCYGLFSVLGKRQDYDRVTSLMFYFLFAFVFALAAVLAFSSIPSPDAFQLAGMLWQGVFILALSYVLWFTALRQADTGLVSNLILLTPFVSLVYIFLFLGEPIALSTVAGLLLIVFGILIQGYRNKPAPRRNSARLKGKTMAKKKH